MGILDLAGMERGFLTPMDGMDRILDLGSGMGKIGMDEGDEWGFWIPACAGMTVVEERRLRGNDGCKGRNGGEFDDKLQNAVCGRVR